MKTKALIPSVISVKTTARRLTIARAMNIPLLPLLVLLTVPAVVEGQFSYTTTNGTITITGYTGLGGAVTIPDRIPDTTDGLPVTGIGSEAFVECTNLTSVTIPGSVTNIGYAPFEACTSLTAITVDALNPFYSSADGVLFDYSQTTLIQYPGGKAGGYAIPNSVTDIGTWGFALCALTSATLGTGITNIGELAFGGCSNLTTVTIDNGLTAIGELAFFDCSSLTSVTVPNSVTSIGEDAFNGCSRLPSVAIPASVTNIGSYAFADCASLISVSIPAGVSSIAEGAFEGCDDLTTITIPNSIANIGASAFNSCFSLASITIPNSVTNIGDAAFAWCSSLNGVYFQGNAPMPSTDVWMFNGDYKTTIYYLPGTTGWSSTFDGHPAVLWNPQPQTTGSSFGVSTNGFGFSINGASGMTIVVEASTDLSNPTWVPLQTNILTGGLFYFSDPQWTNYPGRFYRLNMP